MNGVARKRWYPLGLICAVNGIDGWDTYAFVVLIPEIRRAFHLSLTAIGAITSLISPFVLLASIPIAVLGDRRRRTGIVAAGMALWAVCAGAIGLAPSVLVLVLVSIGSGIGASGPDRVNRSLLSDFYGPLERAKVLFTFDLANAPVQLVATAASGVIAGVAGWRAAFVVIVPIGLALAWSANRLPEPGRGVLDRELAGADAELAVVEEEPPTLGEAFRVLGSFRSLRLLYLAVPFGFGAAAALNILLSTFLHDDFGLSATARGLSLALIVPSGAVGLVVTGVIVQRRLASGDLAAAIRIAALLDAVAGLAVVALAVAPSLPVAIGVAALEGACSGGVASALYTFGSLVIPPRMRTVGFAVVGLWEVPAVLAPPAFGALADAYGVRAGIGLTAVPALAGAALLALASRHAAGDAERSRREAVIRTEVRRARADGDPVLLSVRELVVDLGGTRIIDGVSIDIRDGELVALLGTNGAGKSTLLRALSGLVLPSAGLAIFDGVELGGADPAKTVDLGMVYAPGAPSLYDGLTVADNLRAASWRAGGTFDEALEVFPSLRPKLGVDASELSGGERQLLNLAMAVVLKPKMLLLDELTLGLSGAAADRVMDAVRALHAAGATIVVVEQSVDRALALADRVIYLDRGAVVFDGSAATLRRRPGILRAAFLGDGSADVEPHLVDRGTAALSGSRISVHYGGVAAVSGVDVHVDAGEILALVGPNGAGKSSLLDALAGAVPADGVVAMGATDITGLSSAARARLGLGRSFQDARLWPSMTVFDAVAVACECHVTEAGALHALVGHPDVRDSEGEIADRVRRALEEFNLADRRDSFVGDLSTGMRRILQLACLVAQEATVMLLDEPAAGVAQREVAGLASVIRGTQRRTGASILIVEHDLALVRAVADRVMVLDGGVVIADGPPGVVLDDPAVQLAYLGRVVRRRGSRLAAVR